MFIIPKDEKLLIVLILAVVIQVPISIVTYTLLTQYTVPYLVFCMIAVICTYAYSKWG